MRNLTVVLTLLAAGCAAQPTDVALRDQFTAAPAQQAARASACASAQGKKVPLTNITEISNVLRGGDFRKSEFEKTSQFKARMAGRVTQAQQKVARTGDGDLFYFALPIPSDQITYNADTSIMKIGGEYASLVKTSMMGDGQLVVKDSWRPTGQTYVGENAFGAKRQIQKVDFAELVVTAPALGRDWWFNNFKGIIVSVPQDQAKSTKENLVVLLAARLKEPYFEVETGHISPTINAPIEVNRRKEIVHLDIDCAAIYNRATGNVIANLSIAAR